MSRGPRRPACAAVILALALAARPLAAQSDVIRGRIIAPDSAPVENATITATMLSGSVSRASKTDKNGRFTITFPGGDGDYMISIAAFGFAAKRFELKRTADEEVLIADAKLQRSAVTLDAVRVQAQRERAGRNALTPDVGGSERLVNIAGLSPDQLSDLAALAASMPGVQLIPGADGMNGFSVLGLAPDQNVTTLNGLAFNGSNLPQDAQIASALNTSPYDVSRGGFSGAQFSLRTRPGNNFGTRTMSMNGDVPSLQWTDRAARALGQQYTNFSVGGLVTGPFSIDKAFYSVAYQVSRRANDLQTLLNTGPSGLLAAGIAPDSAQRLRDILGTQGIPSTTPRIGDHRTTDAGRLLASFDINPPSSGSGSAYNITTAASWSRTTAASIGTSLAELPSHSGDRTSGQGSLQGRHTAYFGFGILSETSAGFGASRNFSTPYADLPSGTVRVNSSLPDGSNSLKLVSFGGNPSMNTTQTTTGTSFTNQLSWFSENNKHRLKFTDELRLESFSQDLTANALGSFMYNSLADLAANAPASFTRTLTPRRQSASQYIGALSLGDSYRPSTDVQVQYGLRLDGNRFASAPNANPEVERLLGVRNDQLPNHFYLSPRIGFSWTYGTAPQIGGFEGAMRGPRAVVRGGVGVFQNTPGTAGVGSAFDNTGLANAVQQLTCVGPTTPLPDWSVYTNPAAIPGYCADGSAGTVFASSAPAVVLFDPKYQAQRSVRSNLQWNGAALGDRVSTTIDVTYSRNLNQPGGIDLNFLPNTQFQLGDEGGRPVFVRTTSIVPATGAIASRDARVSQSFSRVTEIRSDLRSETRQLTLRLSPFAFSSSHSWSLAYVYSNVRDLTRGFSSTVGNPLDLTWGRSSFDSRHQLVYSVFYNAFDWVRLTWTGQFRSGLPFTPLIAGDVNGDGYSNDRAFIFDPSRVAEAAVASGLRALLDRGSTATRECLAKQLGRLADRNSCQGPWMAAANLQLAFNPLKVRMPQRATLTFNVSNPLGAADLLLHGENGLRGWGQQAFPDNNLLFVRGFDPSTKRYTYEVNQRFGATAPAASTNRAAVVFTAMVRVDVGPTREKQMLLQQLNRGRRLSGQKAQELMIKTMYGNGGVTNPMAQILRNADTLGLTAHQADSIAVLNRVYAARLDSIWTPLARQFAALPDDFDEREVYERYRRGREASIDYLARLAPLVNSLLTLAQRRELPTFVAPFLDTRYLASIRSGTAGASVGAGPTMHGGGDMAVVHGEGGYHGIVRNP